MGKERVRTSTAIWLKQNGMFKRSKKTIFSSFGLFPFYGTLRPFSYSPFSSKSCKGILNNRFGPVKRLKERHLEASESHGTAAEKGTQPESFCDGRTGGDEREKERSGKPIKKFFAEWCMVTRKTKTNCFTSKLFSF